MLQATQAALAAEEPRVARLQTQLKELILSPHDPQLLPTSVVAAIQEYLRYQRGPGGRGPGGGAPGAGLRGFFRLPGLGGELASSCRPATLKSCSHLSKTPLKDCR